MVSKSITQDQIRKLIIRTQIDPQIKKYTHDSKRFKNLTTFRKWQKGKTIYTLSGKNGELLGLIWFGKKRNVLAPGYAFTFAIRIYPPIRGKGYAFKFMKEVFTDFKHQDVWLTTRRDNLPAIRLYKKFGFRKIAEAEKDLVMAL